MQDWAPLLCLLLIIFALAALVISARMAAAPPTRIPTRSDIERERIASSLRGGSIRAQSSDSTRALHAGTGDRHSTLSLRTAAEKYKIKVFDARGSRGANNCLFDSVLSAVALLDDDGVPANAQRLRELCDAVLKEEGLPTIPKNEPAGEQYLQALSLVVGRPLKVRFRGGETFVCHENVAGLSPQPAALKIAHVGDQLHGHWVAV